MASIETYSTKTGKRYRVRYRKPDHSQGAKRGFRTKREAELYLASIEISKARGEFVEHGAARATIAELGQAWLSTQTHLKPSTYRTVADAWRLRVDPRWGRYPVSAIQHSDVQAWVSELSASRSPTVVIRSFGVLAAILDVAVRDRRILSNPARGTTLPRKERKAHTYLTHEQVHQLATEAGPRAALVLTLAYTGLRWGEVAALRVRSVDFERRRINVTENAVEVGGVIHVGSPKTYKTRAVPTPRFLHPYLKDQMSGRERDELLFPGTNGDYMRRTRTSTGSKSWFKTALRNASLEPMTIHDLRHTAASLAVSSGANVKAVQRMLGHASAAMTLDVYSDLFDDDLDAVSDRLDQAVAAASVSKPRP
ncbi:tyrosine-type recombinase/integrase [Agromyces ramosus]|uniref:Integrase n=1 Tax=Agromyces ramosus TaxID=33879 RepID=A0ABU0R8U0_9MICO|nr:tyrosine-type recombinase/integrase [Agromyces ramosus]MDQ0894473.1 integrase [Agromyces ramosus]